MINKAILIGNLGADPELRTTGSGQSVCDLRVATSRKWRDASGAQQEDTQWHRIVVWGKQAESCAEYLAKGRQVYVEGRLQTRKWTDRDGNERYTTEVVAERVQFLSGGSGRREERRAEPRRESLPAPHESAEYREALQDEIPF